MSAMLKHVSVQNDRRMLHTYWDASLNEDVSCRYPYMWLRDNCQCEKCFHPVSKARLVLMRDVDPDICPASTKVDGKAQVMTLTWPDKHQSSYSADWLWHRRFSREKKQSDFIELPMKNWGTELQDKIPKDTFHSLLSDDSALFRFLCDMEETGLFLITHAPRESGQVHKLAERVGFLRKTDYGEHFTVKAKVDPSNIAYTSATLGLHTDLPQLHYVPGVQMLHCIVQAPTEGGENEFADGFHVAELIRQTDPECFRILTTVPVRFYDMGDDYCKFYQLQQKPSITLTTDGNIERINYNNQVRDSILDVSEDDAASLYTALRKFDNALYNPKNMIKIKLQEGEIVCFHNYRVLHGRNGFRVTAGGNRHLEGGYIDWDEMRSRRRVLEQNMEKTGA